MVEIEITCPNCNQPKLVTARRAVPGSVVRCRSCGAEVRLEGDEMRQAQRAFDDLGKAFRRIGK